MSRKFYAAVLKGSEPAGIDKILAFDTPWRRNIWMEGRENVVILPSKVAKLSMKTSNIDSVSVDFRKVYGGYWSWMYNNTPENNFKL